MRRLVLSLAILSAWASSATADDPKPPAPKAAKVLLERDLTHLHGQAPPALQISTWAGEPVSWESLKDKVVVVNFWEVSIAGCRRTNRKLVKLKKRFADRGLEVLAIHPVELAEQALARAKARKLPFHVAIDDAGKTAAAFGGARRVPVIHIVAKGKLVFADVDNRAAGNLERAIEAALAGKTDAKSYTVPRPIAAPDISVVRSAGSAPILKALGGKPAPALKIERWTGKTKADLGALRGKVVLIDFWGTWCGPCVKALPHIKALHAKYAAKGLAIVGVHTTNGKEQLDAFLEQTPLPYPVGVDAENGTVRSYLVRAFPTMIFLDRKGAVRAVRLGWASDAEAIVKKLLAEPAPKPAPKKDGGAKKAPGTDKDSGPNAGK